MIGRFVHATCRTRKKEKKKKTPPKKSDRKIKLHFIGHKENIGVEGKRKRRGIVSRFEGMAKTWIDIIYQTLRITPDPRGS